MESQIVIDFVVKYFYWAFLGWIFITLLQRRHGSKGAKKRMAVLYQAILIFLVMVYGTILKMNELTDIYMVIAAIVVVMVLFFGRKFILPYRTTCRVCRTKLSFERIFFYDDPLCPEHDEEEIENREEIQKEIDKLDHENPEE